MSHPCIAWLAIFGCQTQWILTYWVREFLAFYKSSWALLCYLEIVWSFQVLLYDLLGGCGAVFMPELSIPHFKGKTFLSVLHSAPQTMNDGFRPPGWGHRCCSWPCVSAQHCSSISFTQFLPWPQGVSSHVFTYQHSAEQSGDPLQIWDPLSEQ